MGKGLGCGKKEEGKVFLRCTFCAAVKYDIMPSYDIAEISGTSRKKSSSFGEEEKCTVRKRSEMNE